MHYVEKMPYTTYKSIHWNWYLYSGGGGGGGKQKQKTMEFRKKNQGNSKFFNMELGKYTLTFSFITTNYT